MLLHRRHYPMFLLVALCCSASFWTLPAVGRADEGGSATSGRFSIPFFDGIKLQTTNCNPKLTNANHLIRKVNRLAGSDLNDWDSMLIQTLDLVLWKDLSKYFKLDCALAGSTGSLLSSSTGFQKTPLDVSIRMRQRYGALELWSNLYFYPLTTDCRDEYASGRVIEPFIAAGLGYTWFRSETVFKLRKGNFFYNRARSNWNGGEWGYKMMTGFNVNMGNITPRMSRWVVTVSAFQIWNRLKGHATVHLTDELKIAGRRVPVDLKARQKMDIDLTGPYFSLAIGRYF